MMKPETFTLYILEGMLSEIGTVISSDLFEPTREDGYMKMEIIARWENATAVNLLLPDGDKIAIDTNDSYVEKEFVVYSFILWQLMNEVYFENMVETGKPITQDWAKENIPDSAYQLYLPAIHASSRYDLLDERFAALLKEGEAQILWSTLNVAMYQNQLNPEFRQLEPEIRLPSKSPEVWGMSELFNIGAYDRYIQRYLKNMPLLLRYLDFPLRAELYLRCIESCLKIDNTIILEDLCSLGSFSTLRGNYPESFFKGLHSYYLGRYSAAEEMFMLSIEETSRDSMYNGSERHSRIFLISSLLRQEKYDRAKNETSYLVPRPIDQIEDHLEYFDYERIEWETLNETSSLDLTRNQSEKLSYYRSWCLDHWDKLAEHKDIFISDISSIQKTWRMRKYPIFHYLLSKKYELLEQYDEAHLEALRCLSYSDIESANYCIKTKRNLIQKTSSEYREDLVDTISYEKLEPKQILPELRNILYYYRRDGHSDLFLELALFLDSQGILPENFFFHAGYESQKIGDYKTSENFYLRHLDSNPEDSIALINLSNTYVALGDLDLARTKAEELLNFDSENKQAHSLIDHIDNPKASVVEPEKALSIKYNSVARELTYGSSTKSIRANTQLMKPLLEGLFKTPSESCEMTTFLESAGLDPLTPEKQLSNSLDNINRNLKKLGIKGSIFRISEACILTSEDWLHRLEFK